MYQLSWWGETEVKTSTSNLESEMLDLSTWETTNLKFNYYMVYPGAPRGITLQVCCALVLALWTSRWAWKSWNPTYQLSRLRYVATSIKKRDTSAPESVLSRIPSNVSLFMWCPGYLWVARTTISAWPKLVWPVLKGSKGPGSTWGRLEIEPANINFRWGAGPMTGVIRLEAITFLPALKVSTQ